MTEVLETVWPEEIPEVAYSLQPGVGVRCCLCCWIGSFYVPRGLPNLPTFDSVEEALQELPLFGWSRAVDLEPDGEVPACEQRWRCPECAAFHECDVDGHQPVRTRRELNRYGYWWGEGTQCARCRSWLDRPVRSRAGLVVRAAGRVYRAVTEFRRRLRTPVNGF